MPLTVYTAKKLTDHILSIGAFVMPAQIWGGLHTDSPTPFGATIHEIPLAGTGYGRINLTGLLSTADVSTGISQLFQPIESGVALLDWGKITHFSLSDASIGGNMLAYAELTEAETIYAGNKFHREPGQIQFRFF